MSDADRIASLEAEVAASKAALLNAWERMDRARNILTGGNPRPACNWGLLDTSLDRAALDSAIAAKGK